MSMITFHDISMVGILLMVKALHTSLCQNWPPRSPAEMSLLSSLHYIIIDNVTIVPRWKHWHFNEYKSLS